VLRDHAAHQGGQQLNIAGVEIAIGDLLDNDSRGGAALAEATILLGQVDAYEHEIADRRQQRAFDAVLLGALLVAGRELLARKSSCGFAKRLLLLAERVVHELSH
jgi:hypothetical protein